MRRPPQPPRRQAIPAPSGQAASRLHRRIDRIKRRQGCRHDQVARRHAAGRRGHRGL